VHNRKTKKDTLPGGTAICGPLIRLGLHLGIVWHTWHYTVDIYQSDGICLLSAAWNAVETEIVWQQEYCFYA